MIVDVHAHIGSLHGRGGSFEDLEAHVTALGCDVALVSNLDGASVGEGARDVQEPEANLACLQACQRDARLRPLYWARPGRRDSNVYAIAGALESESFLGAVFSPPLNDHAASEEDLGEVLDVVAKLGRVAFVQVGKTPAARPARVYDLARRRPNTPFVLYNAGGDTHWREALDCAGRAAARSDARLYIDTAGISPADVRAAAQEVGPGQVLFGSDAGGRGAAFSRHIAAWLDELGGLLSASDFKLVTGGAALKLFRLGY